MSDNVQTDSSIQDIGIPEIQVEVSAMEEVQWPVDPTLSIAEEAADAKATGEAIQAAILGASSRMDDMEEALSASITQTESLLRAEMEEDYSALSAAIQQSTSTLNGAIEALSSRLDGDIGGVDEKLESMFPVGSILITASATTPAFGFGTWAEVVMPMTWGDLKNGTRSFQTGTGTGTIHFWMRTA